MKAIVKRSSIEGFFRPPPSKSITHRALVIAGLAKGTSRIIAPSICDDTLATIEALERLGIKTVLEEGKLTIEGGKFTAPKEEIFCRSSGTTLRFMTAVCTLVGKECRLTGSEGLMRRPMEPLLEALRQLGVECYRERLKISVKGKPKSGQVNIRGDISSQFISALLLISPLIEGGVLISSQTEIQSLPYISLTLDVQSKFGVEVKNIENRRFEVFPQEYKATTLTVEGDWSSAAYVLTAAALTGRIIAEGLNLGSLQADKALINLMKKMGARIRIDEKSITVERSPLKPIEFDISNCPDLFPAACVLCSQAGGSSLITGVERLKSKESNRLEAMETCLKSMNIKVEKELNAIRISGSKAHGSRIYPYNDHRIAMACAILGLVAEGQTVIENAECVTKSFPEFWNVISSLNANVQVVE
ncbi:MAG: 3-phosphoshikimate 1-carboxyvinyltransferase [Nitrososphaeria archaeon]